MIRHARRKVMRFEERPCTVGVETYGPRISVYAILECGHEQLVGLLDANGHYSPKRMACALCPGARRVM